MWTAMKWVGILLIVLVAGLIVTMSIMDWNWVKGNLSRVASDAIGQPMTIAGDVDVDLWSWTPQLQAEQLQIDNVDWGQAPHMLTLRRLTLQIDLRQLLQGQLVFPQIELLEPVANLERSAAGQLNWTTLGRPTPDRTERIANRQIATWSAAYCTSV